MVALGLKQGMLCSLGPFMELWYHPYMLRYADYINLDGARHAVDHEKSNLQGMLHSPTRQH